jgi:hypothetical protein
MGYKKNVKLDTHSETDPELGFDSDFKGSESKKMDGTKIDRTASG